MMTGTIALFRAWLVKLLGGNFVMGEVFTVCLIFECSGRMFSIVILIGVYCLMQAMYSLPAHNIDNGRRKPYEPLLIAFVPEST